MKKKTLQRKKKFLHKFQKQKDELDKNSEYIAELETKKNMAEKFIPVIEKIHKKNDYEDRINILNDEIKTDKEKLEQAVKQLEAKKKVYRSSIEKENLTEKKEVLTKEIKCLEIQKEKLSDDIKIFTDILDSLEKEKSEIKDISQDEKKEVLTKEIKCLEIQKEKLSDDIKIFTDILDSLEKEKSEIKDISQDEILNLEKEILKKKSLYENLEKREKELEKEGDICPVCHGIYHKYSEAEKESSFNEEVFEQLQNNIRNIKSSVQIEKEKLNKKKKKDNR